MNSISFGAINSPLTQADITRLPNQKKSVGSYYMTPDVYMQPEKKKSGFAGFVKKVIVAAAAIVLIKHLGKNSFLKPATLDAAKMTNLDKAKTIFMKVATAIEKPFIQLYNKAKVFLAQKAAQAK